MFKRVTENSGSFLHKRRSNVMKALFFLSGIGLVLMCLVWACTNESSGIFKEYTHHPHGYYYHLVEIGETGTPGKEKLYYWLDLKFKTQRDSVFWNSRHEGAGKVFVKTDVADNYLAEYIRHLNTGDSAIVLFPVKIFFKQQFNSNRLPYFCKADSLVKVELRVKQVLTFNDWQQLSSSFRNTEAQDVQRYLHQTGIPAFVDSLGVCWLDKQALPEPVLASGNQVTFSFQGQFLDGRWLDTRPQSLTYTIGTPDQVLKGINYVIKHMKKGENIKIILPSHLAFGEQGSSNGSVPPFTPLVYTLTLIDVKQND